jgi:type IV secretion system protein VirB10
MKQRFVDTAALIVIALAIAPVLHAQSATPPAAPAQAAAPASAPAQAQAHPATPANATPAQPSSTAASPAAVASLPKYFEVPSGTRLPLVLHNAISTRSAQPGDPVYLETLFPIVIDSRILIPAGSYVSGEVTEAKRPGRIHGRGEIKIKLDNLILPNGYQASFNASPTGAGTGGNESVGKEGAIKGDSNKAGDAGTVLETTAAGAGLGGIVGQSARGAGIGAGAGAAAGLLAVLLTRGPEAELPRGTTLDVVMNRPLYLLSSKANFTTPGQASTLAGPPNREPQRRAGIVPY